MKVMSIPTVISAGAIEARIVDPGALIPLGLEAVAEELERGVVALAGERHARQGRFRDPT